MWWLFESNLRKKGRTRTSEEAHSMLLTWSSGRSRRTLEVYRKKPGTTQWNGDKFKPNDAMACAKRREARQYLDTFCQVRTDFGREDPVLSTTTPSVPYRRSGDYNFSLCPDVLHTHTREWHDLCTPGGPGVGFTTGLRGGLRSSALSGLSQTVAIRSISEGTGTTRPVQPAKGEHKNVK